MKKPKGELFSILKNNEVYELLEIFEKNNY